MGFRKSEREKYLADLANRMQGLAHITQPVHPRGAIRRHDYEEDPAEPGVCKHCGWLNQHDLEVLDCGHTAYDHALGLLEILKEIRKDVRVMSDEEFEEALEAKSITLGIILIPIEQHPDAPGYSFSLS